MKFVVISKMTTHYSGGRYHAWNLAESLAAQGNDVYFIANNESVFAEDFVNNPGHENVHLILHKLEGLREMDELIPSEIDFLVMVPHRGTNLDVYREARELCRRKNAKMVLLNFESPNWMNKYVQTPLDEELWSGWKYLCEEECIVLSTDKESTKYAKEFYGNKPFLKYVEWNLSINTLIANQVQRKDKENRVITFIRLTDEHKGGRDILRCIDQTMQGYTFVFVYGVGKKNEQYLAFVEELEKLKKIYDFNYEMKIQLSEKEKFEELSRAKFLLFPSYFEGYGLPPIEAMYMGTTCIAYDLPVLREICGDGLIYCKHGDCNDMAEKLHDFVKNEANIKNNDILREKIENIADFEKGSVRLNRLFKELSGDR